MSAVRRLRLVIPLLSALVALALPGFAHAQDPELCDPPVLSPVACENTKPGSPPGEWDVYRHGDDKLQGFATAMSVNRGSAISFKVDTTYSGYRIDIYRLGYYGGLGARRVASNLSHAAAASQPACLTDSSTGLIDCGNWSTSATWNVPSTAVSGVYIAKLTPSSGATDGSHITFVVRNDSSSADIVLQTSDATWQAYNTYGGNSLYSCTVACPPGNPLAYKAALAVSYNRPFHTASDDQGRSWLTYTELPMIRFLERSGYDVTYVSQVDVERRGSRLLDHDLFISSGHDEYWSANQRASVEAARDAGVNLAFFSGNLMFWKTRYAPSADGSATPDRTLISYKDTHFDAPADPVEWTGTWRDRRFDGPGPDYEPENALTGVSFRVNLGDAPITVPAAFKDLRMWRNTAVANLQPGGSLALAPSTLGYEWDEDADNGYRPAGQFRLSSTTVSGVEVFTDYGSSVTLGTSTHNLTMHRRPSGALVFSTGTVQWAFGLDDTNPSGSPPNATMQQATVNLFADMGAQPLTLPTGLVPATKSNDTAAPTASVTSPAPGSSQPDGTRITIAGTASDTGGVVAGVEVSTDGGTTWHPATGTTNWTYSWVVHGHPQTAIRARAVDDSGNLGSPTPPVTVDVACGCSIFGTGMTPATVDSGDPTPAELGVKFRARSYGAVTGIRFYKSAANTGTHIGSLWTASGQKLAQVTFQSESASGWQTATFSSPVTLEADKTYVASYFAPNGRYSVTPAYFWRRPSPPPHGFGTTESGPLEALRNADGTTNGVFAYTSTPQFPVLSHNAANYWVDVVYQPIPAPGQVTGVTATEAGRTKAQVAWNAPADGGTPTSYTITPFVGGDPQPSTTVTGSPPPTTATVTGLTQGTAYRFRVRAANPAGTGPDSELSNAVTPTDAVAPSPPTNVHASPATTSALVRWTAPGSDGDSPITGYTITPYVGGSAQAPVEAAAGATSKTVTGLTHGTAYSFRIVARNAIGSSEPSAPSGPVTPQHSVLDFAAPAVVDSQDSSAVELGMKFTVDTNATAVGVRFYKAAANTGTHVGSLWTAGGTRLAQATFADESADGWQAASFATPVALTAGTTYVVSYFAPSGRYSFTGQGLADGVDNPPLRAVANSTSANGVYRYGFTSGFPASTYNAASYLVDVLVAVPPPGKPGAVSAAEGGSTSARVAWSVPSTGGPVSSYRITPYVGSAPQAATTVPASQTTAKVRNLTTGTTYTFRVEALNAGGAGPASDPSNPVTPLAPIAPGAPTGVAAEPGTRSALVSWTAPDDDGDSPITGYTITPYAGATAESPVQVGPSATAATVSGLANGTSYTFRVRASNAAGTGPESAASDSVVPRYTLLGLAAPPVADSGDGGAVELGMKFRPSDNGRVTGVRFYKSSANTGTHSGSLWTTGGTRLAQVTFGGETANGWQSALFSQPVAVTAGQTYVISYHAPRGHYAVSSGAFSAPIDQPPLRALSASESANGVFAYGPASQFPTGSYNASNYWVDVLYEAEPAPGAPTNVTAAAGRSSASVSWSAPTSGGAPTAYEVTPYAGTTAGAVTTVEGSPPATTVVVRDLTPGTAYTFRVRALNREGGSPLSAASNSVTPTAAVAPGPPTGVTAEADTRSAVVSWTAPADDGGSPITGYRVTPYVGSAAQPTVTVSGPTTSRRIADLQNGTAHTFRVQAVNDAGTGDESAASNAVTPLSSIFEWATPGTVDSGDGNAIQVGVKFRSSVAGRVVGIRFYKAAANTGAHVGNLWTADGQQLAQRTFGSETASGWQKVVFATPIAIQPDITYVAGYHTPNGHYSVTSAAFSSGPVSNPPLTALANDVSSNGVYAYSAGPTFPSSTYNAANYWVDVLFEPGAGS